MIGIRKYVPFIFSIYNQSLKLIFVLDKDNTLIKNQRVMLNLLLIGKQPNDF